MHHLDKPYDNSSVKTVLTDSPQEAAQFIRRGGIVAFPTETVYGLGAGLFDESAINRIFESKRRPADNPLIVHVADRHQISKVVAEITSSAGKFIDAFFPGPLTVVLKKHVDVPLIVTAGLETVGVRMPKNETAQEFLKTCGTPVVAPSANLSGRPSPTTWAAVAEDLDGTVDCILKGEQTEIGLESSVVDCTGEVPVLLRAGAISLENLKKVVPETQTVGSEVSLAKRSPGLRHRHYKPAAKVRLVSAGEEIALPERAAYIGLHQPYEAFALVKICTSVDDYARELFEFFRECDRQGIATIHCEMVETLDIGQALMDRLLRASS